MLSKYAKGLIAIASMSILVLQQYGIDLCAPDSQTLAGLPIKQFVAPLVAVIGSYLVVKTPNSPA